MIRKTVESDTPAILSIIELSGQFDRDGLEHVKKTLSAYLGGETEDLWLTADDEGIPVGVAYAAPEPVTDGTWNLLMLWMHPDHHGKGLGNALVKQVEEILSDDEVRLLIVETSGLDDFGRAREFYDSCGFEQEARVKNFFAAGDDKLIYTKPLC